MGVAALLVTLVAILAVLGGVGILSLPYMAANWSTMLGPAALSVGLTSAAFSLGFLIAIPLGWLRAFGPRLVRGVRGSPLARSRVGDLGARGALAAAYGAVSGYVEIIRGTPFFVQVFLVYFAVIFAWPHLPFVNEIAGLVALTVNTAGYQSEVLRAGFQSVGQNQVDAARALGMRGRQTFAHVTMPQALRLVVLPLTNEWISLFKASTLLAYIAVPELFFQASQLGGGRPIEGFIMVALFYLGIIVPLGRTVAYIERKRRIPGLGVPIERRARRGPAPGGGPTVPAA